MWWNNKYGKNSFCGITKTRLRPGKDKDGISYICKLPCKHYFYRKAIQEWILHVENPTCPLCRKSFNIIKFFNNK